MDGKLKQLSEILGSGEAALVASVANRFYLSGFDTSAGYVLVMPKTAYFLVDFRYFEKAKSISQGCEVRLSASFLKDVAQLSQQNGINKILVEAEHTSIKELEGLRVALDGLEIITDNRLDSALCSLRAVKDRGELESIKAAQALTDQTYSYILERISVGRTEREVMLDMEFFMRRMGSEGVSFDFIVVSGKNSSLPHGVPTDKKIEKGDFVTMDFGAVVDGYRSDMTRTVAVGAASDEQKMVYNTVLKAQTAALSEIAAGKKCCDVDKIARDIIYAAGFEGCFGHALGHSVGVEIHESPNFSPKSMDTLKCGNIMTVEPGIYIPEKFGVRIEDMVYVTENGCENLTNSPKELIIL